MRLIPIIFLAGMVLVGCGTPANAQQPVKTDVVTMPPSYRFDPVVIQVPVGTTVTWRNDDHFTHSVHMLTGDFSMLNLPPGATASLTFAQPGTYDYVCTYHAQDMKGKVVVVDQ